jgi:cyanophycin synthetase
MRDLGRVAARYFDDVIVREDQNTRGRERGETARIVTEGVREAMLQPGTRVGNVEIVTDEMDATRRALDRSRPGDLVVLCVDYATAVFQELERRRSLAAPNVMSADGNGRWEAVGGDPDLMHVVGDSDVGL